MISGGRNKLFVLAGGVRCLVVVGGLLLTGLTVASGEPALSITPSLQLGLADCFFVEKNYSQAIVEYQKYLYFFPDDPCAPYAEYRIALAYFEDGRYEAALEHFEPFAASQKAPAGLSLEATFMISRCLLALGNSAAAATRMQYLLTATGKPAVQDRASYALAWIHLERLAESPEVHLEQALVCLEKIHGPRRRDYRLEELSRLLEKAEKDTDGLVASRKHPAVAGYLALFPGAGYAYCGRHHDAVTAFLFNAAMIYAAYEAFDSGHEALGAVITFVELGFYTGSIYGSITAAHKANRSQAENFLGRLQAVRVSISPADSRGGIVGCLQVPF